MLVGVGIYMLIGVILFAIFGNVVFKRLHRMEQEEQPGSLVKPIQAGVNAIGKKSFIAILVVVSAFGWFPITCFLIVQFLRDSV